MDEQEWYEALWDDLKGWFASLEGTITFDEEGDVSGELQFGRDRIPWQFVLTGLLVLVIVLVWRR